MKKKRSLICSMDAIKAGTTCAIDHHASPSYIKGSLSTIAKGDNLNELINSNLSKNNL